MFLFVTLEVMDNAKKGKDNTDAGSNVQKLNHDSSSDRPVDRDKVKSEREARRLAKQSAKQKLQDKSRNLPPNPSPESKNKVVSQENTASKAEKTATKADASSKQTDSKAARRKERKSTENESKPHTQAADITVKLEKLKIEKEEATISGSSNAPGAEKTNAENKSNKQLTKAERRALQEAQRAAKAAKTATVQNVANVGKQTSSKKEPIAPTSKPKSPAASRVIGKKTRISRRPSTRSSNLHRVKLFKHLYTDKSILNENINSSNLHPAIVRLGVQYASGVVKGCNARCLAFMNAIKTVIREYETPPQKVFSRGIEEAIQPCLAYLHQCRPLAVSVTNAMKYIKWQTTQLPPSGSDPECKALLLEAIDTYIRDQIEKAVEAISITVQEKISDGDVILTFGCSSVIQNILNEAKSSKRDFRVIVVDARPYHEGQEMLRRLAKDIKCTCVLINAVGFIMPEVCVLNIFAK